MSPEYLKFMKLQAAELWQEFGREPTVAEVRAIYPLVSDAAIAGALNDLRAERNRGGVPVWAWVAGAFAVAWIVLR